jgi:hypothetical protein
MNSSREKDLGLNQKIKNAFIICTTNIITINKLSRLKSNGEPRLIKYGRING